MKWTMKGYTKFIGTDGDYYVTMSKSSIGWTWTLFKSDEPIDSCFRYAPTDGELACKAQVEKVISKLKLTHKIK